RGWLSDHASWGVPPPSAMGVLRVRGGRGAGSHSLPHWGCLPPCEGGPKKPGGKRGWLSVPALGGASHHCDGGPKSQGGKRGWLSVPASWGVPPTPAMGVLRSQGGKRGWLLVPASLGLPPPPAMGVPRARGGRGVGSESQPHGGCLPHCDGGPKSQGGK
ncbi:putative uncharacterized protein FLJ45355, partial [Gorilla gorilla gorilla]|uniref:putative uncharacterized protein FLJ45355 n=1 Tax=Gorilla gorilla gorilla TaxID=9595 RepID=UPI0030094F56